MNMSKFVLSSEMTDLMYKVFDDSVYRLNEEKRLEIIKLMIEDGFEIHLFLLTNLMEQYLDDGDSKSLRLIFDLFQPGDLPHYILRTAVARNDFNRTETILDTAESFNFKKTYDYADKYLIIAIESENSDIVDLLMMNTNKLVFSSNIAKLANKAIENSKNAGFIDKIRKLFPLDPA